MRRLRGSRARAPFLPHRRPPLLAGRHQPAWKRRLDALAIDDAAPQMEGNVPCWCGEKNPYYEPLRRGCGGSGTIDCICGGEFCICHWHGETECFGCADCEREYDQSDDYDLYLEAAQR